MDREVYHWKFTFKPLIMNAIIFLTLVWVPIFGFSQVVNSDAYAIMDSAAVAMEVDSLHNIALQFARDGKIQKAIATFQSAYDLITEKIGKENEKYAACINSLGICYYKIDDYNKSEAFFKEAKEVYLRIFGKENKHYASTLQNLGNVYRNSGRYNEAESYYLEAKSIRGKVLGKENAEYALVIQNLARLYTHIDRYEDAEPLYLESVCINEKVSGKESTNYASSIISLAGFYLIIGKYEDIEMLYQKAIGILAKENKVENSEYAVALDGLANYYVDTGRYSEAEVCYLKEKLIWENLVGKENSRTAICLNNLGILYYKQKCYNKAISSYIEAKNIREKLYGVRTHQYAESIENLANIYLDTGEYNKAESFYIDVKNIKEKIFGTSSLPYAESLNNIASLYLETSRIDSSKVLYLKTLAMFKKILGKDTPQYKVPLKNLAIAYWLLGDINNAKYIWVETYGLVQKLIIKSINQFSVKDLLLYRNTFEEDLNLLLSFTQKSNLNDSILNNCIYNAVIFHKGFLLAASNRIHHLAQTDSTTIKQYNWLKIYCRRLAAEYSKPTAERNGLPELEFKADSIEKVLVRSVAGFGEALRQVEWKEVLAQLKPGEAAVEFVHFNYYNPKLTDSTMYAALILRPGDDVSHFLFLFEEREIAPLIKGASGRAVSRINALYLGVQGEKLYNLIWKPLELHLKDIKTVYCSPSGLLHRLNLAAIASNSPSGKRVAEVITLGSTRQLVIPDTTARTNTDAVLFGGVRYTADTIAIAAANVGMAVRNWPTNLPFHTDTLKRGGTWDYLSASIDEVLNLKQTLQSVQWTVQLDTGYHATEEAFRSIGQGKPSPRILHIATHGFFYPDPKEVIDGQHLAIGSEPVFKLSDHPMIRSGLLLAGANEAWSTGKAPANREDGILTAYEISQMNLSNTELVVLSACETGLGEIEGKEGVYGLQRAFKIAGAKYLIMSLWQVSDLTTKELMTDFYHQWLVNGLEIPAAFRKAQQNMKTKYPDTPYHWAGFVLVE